jgi:hypothetical protein
LTSSSSSHVILDFILFYFFYPHEMERGRN